MSLYTRARKHIDMNHVKELREEKIKRKKIADDIREQIREELKYFNSPEFSNWRSGIAEGMTSSGLFQTTLPATGDADLSITSMDTSSFEAGEFTVGVSFNSGTNSGFTGGFSADGGIMNFGGDVDHYTGAQTNTLDLSQVDTVNISAIAGNNSNGGMLPSNDLRISFRDSVDNESDEITVLSKTSSSFSNVNINIPNEWRKSEVKIFVYSPTGEFSDQGQHLKPFTISINGLNHGTMGSIPFGVGGSTGINNLVSSYLQRAATTANYKLLGQTLWVNIQNAKNGFSLGANPNSEDPGQGPTINLNNWDPAPVSGNRNENGTAPDAAGNDAPGVTDADYIYIGKHIFDTYQNSKLYGVSNISLRRRTPMSVFVALDSPEATAFIRTDPSIQGLSSGEAKKKLEDMLDAGDEYLLKYLGITQFSARPTETTMPNSWDQAAAQQGPMPTGPSGYKKPGSYDPNKFYNLAPGSLPSPNIPYTGPGRSNVPGTTDYGNVAATYGGADAERQQKLNKSKKGLIPGRGQYPYRPGTNQLYNPQTGLNVNLSAHHEPEGEVLSEKKKKSFKDLSKKIPGYYDGKPAPLGFPMQEPPKMKNGFHPDLVDGKKIANRFNRLDPQSAKAMPPTGNPYIDKKVRAAAKKPK